jgi:broad specificity phosphatase PhoE
VSKPQRIVLIRHGNSEANADGAVRAHTPDHRIALTDEGVTQARKAGKTLAKLFGPDPVAIYLSPYLRTRQTWNGIKEGAAESLNVWREYEDPRLREQDFGHLRPAEAAALIDAERSAFGTFFYRVPDGESGADVFDRISGFLDTLWRDFAKPDYPPNALIVSHGLTIRLFLMRWFHWPVEHFERLKNPFNCEHFLIQLTPDGKYELKCVLREHTPEETDRWIRSGGKPSTPAE